MAALQSRSWTSIQFIWKCPYNRQVWILQMLVHSRSPALGRLAVTRRCAQPRWSSQSLRPSGRAASAALKNVLVTEKSPAKLSTGLTILNKCFLSSWLLSPKIFLLVLVGKLVATRTDPQRGLGQLQRAHWERGCGYTCTMVNVPQEKPSGRVSVGSLVPPHRNTHRACTHSTEQWQSEKAPRMGSPFPQVLPRVRTFLLAPVPGDTKGLKALLCLLPASSAYKEIQWRLTMLIIWQAYRGLAALGDFPCSQAKLPWRVWAQVCRLFPQSIFKSF